MRYEDLIEVSSRYDDLICIIGAQGIDGLFRAELADLTLNPG
jgi:hypothetical protein